MRNISNFSSGHIKSKHLTPHHSQNTQPAKQVTPQIRPAVPHPHVPPLPLLLESCGTTCCGVWCWTWHSTSTGTTAPAATSSRRCCWGSSPTATAGTCASTGPTSDWAWRWGRSSSRRTSTRRAKWGLNVPWNYFVFLFFSFPFSFSLFSFLKTK